MNRTLPGLLLLLASASTTLGDGAPHWAFVPPKRAEPPTVKEIGWAPKFCRPLHPRPPRSRRAETRARGRPPDASSAGSAST